jgi:hypothetical protein
MAEIQVVADQLLLTILLLEEQVPEPVPVVSLMVASMVQAMVAMV